MKKFAFKTLQGFVANDRGRNDFQIWWWNPSKEELEIHSQGRRKRTVTFWLWLNGDHCTVVLRTMLCRHKRGEYRFFDFKSQFPNYFVFTLGHYLFVLFLVQFGNEPSNQLWFFLRKDRASWFYHFLVMIFEAWYWRSILCYKTILKDIRAWDSIMGSHCFFGLK